MSPGKRRCVLAMTSRSGNANFLASCFPSQPSLLRGRSRLKTNPQATFNGRKEMSMSTTQIVFRRKVSTLVLLFISLGAVCFRAVRHNIFQSTGS